MSDFYHDISHIIIIQDMTCSMKKGEVGRGGVNQVAGRIVPVFPDYCLKSQSRKVYSVQL